MFMSQTVDSRQKVTNPLDSGGSLVAGMLVCHFSPRFNCLPVATTEFEVNLPYATTSIEKEWMINLTWSPNLVCCETNPQVSNLVM